MYNLCMRPAIFLDRDGVIIENRANYVRSWDDVAFIPPALRALAWAKQSPYLFIIVTNQSFVGRGLATLHQAEEINRLVVNEIVRNDGRIDGVYMCPHAPRDRCSCRKPKPGLLLQAAQDHSLDLSRSFMVGDALSDLKAAEAAGVNNRVLVLTGRGTEQTALPEAVTLKPFLTCQSLEEALRTFLS
jgi:D-glycero-D-manno-heptose 1,7-bisphosphate phosphatase